MLTVLIIAGILVFLLLLWVWCVAPGRGGDFTNLEKFDYAHRGLHDLSPGAPENSLEAFRRAVKAGYGVEFDLQLTKDDRVVVHHDASLKRSCGEDVLISSLTYEELGKYRLFGTEERIPLLSEVLEVMAGKTPMIVEFKSYGEGEKLCRLAMEELDAYRGDYCVESFDPRIVRWFRKNRPEIIRGQLMCKIKGDKLFSRLASLAARNLFTNFYARPHFEAYDIHARDLPSLYLAKSICGMKEVSWTVRTQEEYLRTKKLNSLCIFEGFIPENSNPQDVGGRK